MSNDNVRSVTMTPTTAAITQRRFVGIGANGAVAQIAARGAAAVGVALEASASGETYTIPVTILDGSIQEVEAGAAISVASARTITVDATGRAVAADTTGDSILGFALTAASAAGEIITFISARGARQVP